MRDYPRNLVVEMRRNPIVQWPDAYPLRLMKRNRRNEEYKYKRLMLKRPWTKHIVDFEHGTVLGRNSRSWGKILFFYLMFYLCLSIYWMLLYFVFWQTINSEVPTYLLPQPGLSFQPCHAYMGFCRIEYSAGSNLEVDPYVEQIYQFLQKYDENVDLQDRFGPCVWQKDYGFRQFKPCVFLKINRIIGFTAKPYFDAATLPKDAPEDLRDFINSVAPAELENEHVWLSCQALNDDQVHFAYYPDPYVYAKYLHTTKKIQYTNKYRITFDEKDGKNVEFNSDKVYYNEDDFHRIVAVQINNFPMDKTVSFKCFEWAHNIKRESYGINNDGMIYFEVLIHSQAQ